MSLTGIETRRITPAIGLEIRGVDLRHGLTPALADRLYELLIEGEVIFLDGSGVDAATLLEFAKSFGDVQGAHHTYPHVDGLPSVSELAFGGDTGVEPDTDVWHTDLTFKPDPPFASVLHSQVVPDTGGDTLWASMTAAWDALPADMQKMLEGVQAVHDFGSFRNNFVADGGEARLNEKMASLGQAVHDIVQTHPVSGRRYLYVNRGFTFHVLDQSTADSQRLLTYLLDHVERPEFQLRHRWTAGTIAMWDNRVTQHYAVNDYLPEYRRMHRITVVNDRRAPASPA